MQDSSTSYPRWRQLLALGRELVAHLEIDKQRELIQRAAGDLLPGEATLWIDASIYPPPQSGSIVDPPAPPSAPMRRALAEAQLVVEGDTVAVPLRGATEILGVLEIERIGRAGLDPDDLALLEGLATQSAAALQASSQVAIERWRLRQLSLVGAVSAEVASVLDLDELTRRVVNNVLRTFGYYYVALFTLEPDQETLLCRASAGPSRLAGGDAIESFAPSVELGQGIVGHVAQTGEEFLAGNVGAEAHYRHVDALPETKSEAALPLTIEDRILGVLDVQSDQPERFDETDVLVLRALADQIAIAVEDARLYSDLRLRADQLSAVADVSRAVASILDLDELLSQVANLIHDQFGYPFVHLYTVDLSQQRIVYRAGWPPHPADTPEGGKPVCTLDESQGTVAWVACRGEAVLLDDMRADPRVAQMIPTHPEARSQLAVPLIFGEEVLGVLDIQSDRRGAFDKQDQMLFKALADSVAIAIRNASLYRSERWRRQVADSMLDVAGLLSAGIDLDQVLDAILARLEALLPCDASAIWLLQDAVLCLSAVRGADESMCVSNSLSTEQTWLDEALRADRPVIRSPGAPPEPLGATLGFEGTYSAIAAPLRAGDQRLGLLTLVHRTPNRYGRGSRAMTAAFASYAAVAIENTRLYQQAQEQAYISTVLLQVAEATQSLTTLDEVLETVVHLMPMLVGIERCALFLWDDNKEAFASVGTGGLSDAERRAFEALQVRPQESPAFNRLRMMREPVFPAGPLRASSGAEPDPLHPFDSPLLLPLLAHGEVLGAMLVDYEGEEDELRPDELNEERMAILRGIAYQTAMAAENARLLEEQQEEAYVSAALLQVAQAVVSLNELDEILEAIVRITPMLVGVERCAVFLWSDEDEAFEPAQGYGVPLKDSRLPPPAFPLLDAVRKQNQLIVLSSPDEIQNMVPPQAGELVGLDNLETETVLAAPLSVKGNILGALLVVETRTPGRFDERRLEIITGIAQQAALAVQNNQLQREMAERERLEQELELAREIQKTFMPEQLPDLPGWELAVTWRAARQVAGDFYDFFELPGRRMGLVIADVADKGMPAALFMALTRTLMRAAAAEQRSPADALRRVNELLVPDARHGMFVTALYVILSLETGGIVYANAGHHPPLIYRSEKKSLEQLERGQTALGVVDRPEFVEHEAVLDEADCMVLYTDGVTEALSPEGSFFGEARLHRAIKNQDKDESAQRAQDRLMRAVTDFVGENAPSDDITLMVLRRKRVGAP